MPRQKDLKRLVRTRMQKRGESYTTARAQITRKNARKAARQTTVKTTAPSRDGTYPVNKSP